MRAAKLFINPNLSSPLRGGGGGEGRFGFRVVLNKAFGIKVCSEPKTQRPRLNWTA